MKTQQAIRCTTLVILLFMAGSVSAVDYTTVTDLGALPGGAASSYAYSINDNGEIVGLVNLADGSHACRFDAPNVDLGHLGGPGSYAYSINNNRKIVGVAHLGYGFSGRACLFDFTGGGANRNLGILPGYQQSYAYSINNNDQIVGQSETYGPNYASYGRATVFSATGGTPTDLGALGVDAPYSAALAINDHGQIVGWAGLPGTSGHSYRACLFDPTGGGANIDLGGLGGDRSLAYSNNDGQIVGIAQNSAGNARACLFDATGGGANIALDTIDGFNNAGAWFINNHAQIVGSAWNSSGNAHAWLFDPMTGGVTDLNTLIDPASNWVLTEATCINNNGLIVGVGINPDGDVHAFLLPEPATLCLLGLGGFGLLRKRRA